MDPKLEHYIDLVRDISAESLPADHTALAIAEEARRFLASGGCGLPPEMREPDVDGHGRHLIYGDPCAGFVVTAMVWPAGFEGEIHDHGTWGVVGVLEGELEVVDYHTPTGPGPLSERGRGRACAGDVATVVPPGRDLHRMSNPTAGTAISIHVYGTEIKACHAYDPVTGATRALEPRWTTQAQLA